MYFANQRRLCMCEDLTQIQTKYTPSKKTVPLTTGHSSLNSRSFNDSLVCFEISQRHCRLPSLAVLLAMLCYSNLPQLCCDMCSTQQEKQARFSSTAEKKTPRQLFAIASLHPSTTLTTAAYTPWI